MTCRDCQDHDAQAQALAIIGDRLSASFHEPLMELARMIAAPTAVRGVGANSFVAMTVQIEAEATSAHLVQLVGRNPMRKSITMSNSGTTTVYISDDGTKSPVDDSAYPLVAGATLTIDTTADVYAYCRGAAGQVSVIVEEYAL